MKNMIFDIPGQARRVIPLSDKQAIINAQIVHREAMDQQKAQKNWKHLDNTFDFIKIHEGDISQTPYLDTTGNVTIGIGHKVTDAEAMVKLPLVNPLGHDISDDMKRQAYHEIYELRNKPEYKNRVNGSFPNPYKVKLPDAEAVRMAKEYINNELPLVQDKFNDFDTLHPKAQTAIMDIQYNIGNKNFSKEKWPKFYTAIDQRDYDTAAAESHRKDVGIERNKEVKRLLLEAAEEIKAGAIAAPTQNNSTSGLLGEWF